MIFTVTLAAISPAHISGIVDSRKNVLRVFAEQDARDSWLIHNDLTF